MVGFYRPTELHIRTVRNDCDCQNRNYSAQQRVGLYSAHETFFLSTRRLELIFVSFHVEKVRFLRIFAIPGLGRRQSRDSGLEKTAGIRDPGIAIPTCDGQNCDD